MSSGHSVIVGAYGVAERQERRQGLPSGLEADVPGADAVVPGAGVGVVAVESHQVGVKRRNIASCSIENVAS